MAIRNKQKGSTLLISMIMLILLTLIAVSAIESTTTSLQVVGNAQFREEANAAAQQAIENVISNTSFTTTPPPQQTINIGGSNYVVSFLPAPRCNTYKAVDQSESDIPKKCRGSPGIIYCYRTTWDIAAVVENASTGAKAVLHQGVKLLVGMNALTSCGI